MTTEDFLRHAAECEYMAKARGTHTTRLCGAAWPSDGFGAPNWRSSKAPVSSIAPRQGSIAEDQPRLVHRTGRRGIASGVSIASSVWQPPMSTAF